MLEEQKKKLEGKMSEKNKDKEQEPLGSPVDGKSLAGSSPPSPRSTTAPVHAPDPVPAPDLRTSRPPTAGSRPATAGASGTSRPSSGSAPPESGQDQDVLPVEPAEVLP